MDNRSVEISVAPVSIRMFFRRRRNGVMSIEKVFTSVRAALPPDIRVEVFEVPAAGAGLVDILQNLVFCWRNRGAVNHITGDIHYCALAFPAGTCVLTVHDCRLLNSYVGIRRFIYWIIWYILPCAFATKVIAISEVTRHELIKVLTPLRCVVRVIPNPVPTWFAGLDRGDRRDPAPFLLQVGTSDHKRIDVVIEAMSGTGLTLVVVGRVSAAAAELAHSRGVVFREVWDISEAELSELYKTALMLAYVSEYEGFGVPILEAQACGCPIICSNIPVLREVAGKGAVFVDVGDARGVAQWIRLLRDKSDQRTDIIKAGYENVMRFSGDRVGAAYAMVYRDVLRRMKSRIATESSQDGPRERDE